MVISTTAYRRIIMQLRSESICVKGGDRREWCALLSKSTIDICIIQHPATTPFVSLSRDTKVKLKIPLPLSRHMEGRFGNSRANRLTRKRVG